MDIVEALRNGDVSIRSSDDTIKYVNHAAANEIERLREALKDIDSQMRQADRYFLKESTLAALQQKDSK